MDSVNPQNPTTGSPNSQVRELGAGGGGHTGGGERGSMGPLSKGVETIGVAAGGKKARNYVFQTKLDPTQHDEGSPFVPKPPQPSSRAASKMDF